MVNLADCLPKQTKTVTAIYAAYKKVGDTGFMSQTLGISSLGHHCERYLWYAFRQCCKPEFDGRMYRLFETGNLEEARFVKDLRDIGCEVHDIDERRTLERTQQYKVTALGGHVKGYLDSVILGLPEAPKTWHVGEFKTHSAKSFKKLQKEGVKDSKPLHYAQVQLGMHLTKMKRALYLARNKDTDALYSERIYYDKEYAESLVDRAKRVITAVAPPDRCTNRRDYYLCSWCDAHAICWGIDVDGTSKPALPVPILSCRQCCHATPITGKSPHPVVKIDASWRCEKRSDYFAGEGISCAHHLTLPGLLESFTKPIDFSGDYITFENEDGSKWQHGSAEGCFSSKELMTLPASALGKKIIQTAKDLFGAVATACKYDVLARYPRGDSRIVWKGPVDGLLKAWKEKYNEDPLKVRVIEKYDYPDYEAVEFEDGRVAIKWDNGTAEIRQGVE